MTLNARILLIVAFVGSVGAATARTAPVDELKRRGMFGIQLAPVSEEVKSNLGLTDDRGIYITGVVPNSAAQDAGVKGGDLVRKIGTEEVQGFQHGLSLLRKYRAGDTVALTVLREGQEQSLSVTLRPRPKEEWADIDVIYDAAGEPGKRVRILATRPRAEGKAPAVVFLPEPIPNTIEFMGPMQHPMKSMIEKLTKAGFVTLRAERPAVGDSEGDDLSQYTVEGDVASFRAAIAKLKGYDFVDADRVFVLAHGPGASLAPLVARGTEVKGIVTFGAVVRPLQEVLPEVLRRRWKIELVPEDEAKANMEKVVSFLNMMLVEGKKPGEIFEKHPDWKGSLQRMGTDDTFAFGMHYRHAQELAKLKPLPAWSEVTVPVLAVWGKSDYVAEKKDSELLVEAVKKSSAGKAELMEMAETDHMFSRAADQEESVLAGAGSLNPAVVEVLAKWMKEQGGK